MPWKLGKTTKATSRCQGDVLTGIAELEKMFDGSLPSKNGQDCPAVSAARTFLVAQNITLQPDPCFHFPLAPHFVFEIDNKGDSTMLQPCFICVLSWGEAFRQMAFDVVHVAIRVMPALLVWKAYGLWLKKTCFSRSCDAFRAFFPQWLPDVPCKRVDPRTSRDSGVLCPKRFLCSACLNHDRQATWGSLAWRAAICRMWWDRAGDHKIRLWSLDFAFGIKSGNFSVSGSISGDLGELLCF